MPNFKGVLAGLAISTALAGGIVSLGAATTTATAGASTVTAGASVINCGGGGGWRRGCCHRRCCHRSCHHHSCHSSHNRRFRLNVNINNNTVNGARDEVNNTNNNNNV